MKFAHFLVLAACGYKDLDLAFDLDAERPLPYRDVADGLATHLVTILHRDFQPDAPDADQLLVARQGLERTVAYLQAIESAIEAIPTHGPSLSFGELFQLIDAGAPSQLQQIFEAVTANERDDTPDRPDDHLPLFVVLELRDLLESSWPRAEQLAEADRAIAQAISQVQDIIDVLESLSMASR